VHYFEAASATKETKGFTTLPPVEAPGTVRAAAAVSQRRRSASSASETPRTGPEKRQRRQRRRRKRRVGKTRDERVGGQEQPRLVSPLFKCFVSSSSLTATTNKLEGFTG